MTDDVKTKPTPGLAGLLFGWTSARAAGPFTLVTLAALGAALVASEYVQPREGLRLPFEEQPGFYAALGAGAVIGALLIAAALQFLLWRDTPYADDPMDNGVTDEEGRDDDHA